MTYKTYSILGIFIGIFSVGLSLVSAIYLLGTYQDPNQVETDQISKKLPMHFGDGVTFDKVFYNPHANTFTYHYTVGGNSQIQWLLSHRTEKEQVLKTYYHDHLQAANDRGTSVHWTYDDSSGKEFCNITAYSDYPGHRPNDRLQSALDQCGEITGFGVVILLSSLFYWFTSGSSPTISEDDESRVLSYFNGPLQQFSNAAKEGDFSVIATGPYQLNYPMLYVGESHFNVQNCKLTGENTLILQDGTQFNFY